MIRGERIKWGSRRKKKKKAISDLSATVRLLDKLSLSTQSAVELLEARVALQNLIDRQSKRAIHFFYSKFRRQLWTTDKIPKNFLWILLYLYNLPKQPKPSHLKGDRKQILTDFLRQSGMPTLSQQDSKMLENDFSEVELISDNKAVVNSGNFTPNNKYEIACYCLEAMHTYIQANRMFLLERRNFFSESSCLYAATAIITLVFCVYIEFYFRLHLVSAAIIPHVRISSQGQASFSFWF